MEGKNLPRRIVLVAVCCVFLFVRSYAMRSHQAESEWAESESHHLRKTHRTVSICDIIRLDSIIRGCCVCFLTTFSSLCSSTSPNAMHLQQLRSSSSGARGVLQGFFYENVLDSHLDSGLLFEFEHLSRADAEGSQLRLAVVPSFK